MRPLGGVAQRFDAVALAIDRMPQRHQRRAPRRTAGTACGRRSSTPARTRGRERWPLRAGRIGPAPRARRRTPPARRRAASGRRPRHGDPTPTRAHGAGSAAWPPWGQIDRPEPATTGLRSIADYRRRDPDRISTYRRAYSRFASTIRSAAPLKSRHHAAPRRPASVTAVRQQRSSGAPHAATTSATGHGPEWTVAAIASLAGATRVDGLNPSTMASGDAPVSSIARRLDAGPSPPQLRRHSARARRVRSNAIAPAALHSRSCGDCSRNCSDTRWPPKPGSMAYGAIASTSRSG